MSIKPVSILQFSDMSDKDKRRLVFSIVQFLNNELGSDHISEDAKEGLEVASQCLQTAYCMAPEDTHLEVSRPLLNIFTDATKNEPVRFSKAEWPLGICISQS